ncbi:MAG TPA: prolyl oligopeptidase family serine peptidase, partial [Polyangiaceae bacterium]|nr:prolyl oligopeptidase family serine peptidase [Polyangiaceae bacterium]
MCAALESGRDLFASLRGAHRVAYRSPLDGKPSPFGLYVPAEGPLDGSRRYPLVVALHGLNGKPMSMLRIFFGHDEGRSGDWKDRHPVPLEPLPAFVVAPYAHGNAGYRDVGERDVAEIVAWAKRTYPIDEDRVSITGPSMGGTGTAAVAFRRADQFAAAAPLCGYHTWFRRQDVAGGAWRPWERDLLAQRSNFAWAENGRHLPLWVVHGTKDLPVENSGVLIDRYKRLGYSLREEHPELGHNVWQRTYEGQKGYRWLASHRRDPHPTRIVWKTDDLRFGRYAWLEIARLERSLDWGEARAVVSPSPPPGEARIDLKTKGVGALRLARDPAWGAPEGPVTLEVDGARLAFGPGEPVALERAGGAWRKGIAEPEGLHKRGGLAGPLRDVFYEPLVVVYGTLDPALARANEEVARWFARVRGGVDIDYDVVADAAFDPAAFEGRALVLVGGPSSNALTRCFDDRLPIHVTSDPPSVRAGASEFRGDELGAAFIFPNPDQPDRYVVVLAGVDVPGTLRAMSLPDMLPDFVVFDRRMRPARGQFTMGSAEPVWAGSFDERWGLPKAPATPPRLTSPCLTSPRLTSPRAASRALPRAPAPALRPSASPPRPPASPLRPPVSPLRPFASLPRPPAWPLRPSAPRSRRQGRGRCAASPRRRRAPPRGTRRARRCAPARGPRRRTRTRRLRRAGRPSAAPGAPAARRPRPRGRRSRALSRRAART